MTKRALTLGSTVFSNPSSFPHHFDKKHFPNYKRIKGQLVETIVIEYLEKQGFQLLQRNFACRSGEIDLIGFYQNQLLFIEVRFRKSAHYGCAASSINYSKQQKLIKTAKFFLKVYPQLYQYACRFDVVAVTLKAERPMIDWIQNAFY